MDYWKCRRASVSDGVRSYAESQGCQVQDFIPRSRDFLHQWDVFGIFILKIQSRDFFGVFQNSSSKFSNQVFGEIS